MKQKKEILLKNNENKRNQIWQFKLMEYLMYFTVVIIPLYINKSHWMMIGTPKQLLFIGIISCMMILYAWGKISQKDTIMRITKIQSMVVVLFIILGISGLVGEDPQNSFFGIWQSNLNLFLLYAIGIFSFLVAFIIRDNNSVAKRLIACSFFSGVIVALLSYINKGFTVIFNQGSTLGNSSYLGAYLLIIIGLGTILFFLSQKKWQKIVIILGLLVIIFSPTFLNHKIVTGIISLGSVFNNPMTIIGNANAAFLGVIIMVASMISLWMTRNMKKKIQWIGAMLFAGMIAAIIIIGWIFMTVNSPLHKKFIEEKSENRFIFWTIAQQGVVDNPLLGNGFNNYNYTYQKYIPTSMFEKDARLELWVSRPHTIFLEYLSTSGILGLLAYVVLLASVFITLYKLSGENDPYKKIVGIVLGSILIGYTFQNLFGFDTIVPLIFFFIIVAIAGNYSKEYKIKIPIYFFRFAMILIVIIAIMAMRHLVFLPWRESVMLGTITRESNIIKLPKMREDLQAISQVGGIDDTAFIADRSISLILKTLPTITESGRPYVLVEIDSILSELQKDLIWQPRNTRAHLAVGNLIILRMMITKENKEFFIKKGEYHFNEFHRLSPLNPMGFINLANLYMVLGDSEKAYKALRVALTMAPTFPDGYDVAERLLVITPNSSFEKFLDEKKSRWGISLVK